MDQFMNTYYYSDSEVKKYPNLCAYNNFKGIFLRFISQDKSYSRRRYLKVPRPIPQYLRCLESFCDESGKLRRIPNYVLDEIGPAITAINVYPRRLTMKVNEEGNYVLCLKYTNSGILDDQPKTTVFLVYTFKKDMKKFHGYFGKDIAIDDRLPSYHVKANPNNVDESLLVVNYDYGDSSVVSKLSLRIERDTESHIDKLIQSQEGGFTDDLSEVRPCMTMAKAVINRLIPTNAHLVKYHLDRKVAQAEEDFHKNMSLTMFEWKSFSPEVRNIQAFANYMKHCFEDKRTRPIMQNSSEWALIKSPSENEDIEKAKVMLRLRYPFFMIQCALYPTDICVYDIWEEYFQTKITDSDHFQNMNLPVGTVKNMVKFFFDDPAKYRKVFDHFNCVRQKISSKDYKHRFRILAEMIQMKGMNEQLLTPEHVLFFNRINTPVPKEWRFYLRGKFAIITTCHERGHQIIARKKSGKPPVDTIDHINYIDVESEPPEMLSAFDVFEKVAPTIKRNLLDPTTLQFKFENYEFSNTYKTCPTDDDCLAVRFANVYGKLYKVPKIPQDFYERFENHQSKGDYAGGNRDVTGLKNEGNGNVAAEHQSQLICKLCDENVKSYMFPNCGHIYVCELCSLKLLKCPFCNMPGNPKKVFL